MMKKRNYQAVYPVFRLTMIVDFLLFILQPEDTSATAVTDAGDNRYRRFNNRLGGAIKIAFWCAMVLLFWIGFANLAASLSISAVTFFSAFG